MMAIIDGVQVFGSPEEIKHYREINAKTKTQTNPFGKIEDDVPEHVKRYWTGSVKYTLPADTKTRVWI